MAAIWWTASARSASGSFMSGLLGGHPRRCPLCGRCAVWWCYRRGPFPRPFTIYAGNVEDVSLGVGDFARALTNTERRNQRRRERARRRGGTEAGSAGRLRWAQTERRTETRSSTKDYVGAQDDAVNQRAPKSVEGKGLAPQVGFKPTTLRLTAEPSAAASRCKQHRPTHLIAPSRRWRPWARTRANSGEPTAHRMVWSLLGVFGGASRVTARHSTKPVTL